MTKIQTVLTRLQEPSTWRGIIWLLSALGVTIRPELWDSIAAAGMAVVGLLGLLADDPPPRNDPQDREEEHPQ